MRGDRVAALTQLEVDRQIIQDMYRGRSVQFVNTITTYFTNKVEESKDDPNASFRLTRNLMGNCTEYISRQVSTKGNLYIVQSVPLLT